MKMLAMSPAKIELVPRFTFIGEDGKTYQNNEQDSDAVVCVIALAHPDKKLSYQSKSRMQFEEDGTYSVDSASDMLTCVEECVVEIRNMDHFGVGTGKDLIEKAVSGEIGFTRQVTAIVEQSFDIAVGNKIIDNLKKETELSEGEENASE
jgi:hypothetical protein